jgi:hypothetical protein
MLLQRKSKVFIGAIKVVYALDTPDAKTAQIATLKVSCSHGLP